MGSLTQKTWWRKSIFNSWTERPPSGAAWVAATGSVLGSREGGYSSLPAQRGEIQEGDDQAMTIRNCLVLSLFLPH